MIRGRKLLSLAGSFAVAVATTTAHASPKKSWDGTWTGYWGGSAATIVTIAHNKVVRYDYQGVSQPLGAVKVTPDTITFGTDYTVTINKVSDTAASAQYHSPRGDAAADLTKQ